MPQIYQSLTPQAKQAGKTTYLVPVGKDLMFRGDDKGVGFADVKDGISNTLLVVQSDEQHAVPWTSPQDLAVDLKKPAAALVDYPEIGAPVVVGDGRVVSLRKGIEAKPLAAFFTRNANDQAPDSENSPDVVAMHIAHERSRSRSPFGVGQDMFEALGVPELLFKGIGNQAGMHICDSSPLFDFNLPSFLGQAFGSFNGRMMFEGEMLPISFLIASLNSPVYVSVPVRDAGVVDAFLDRLDGLLAGNAREPVRTGWFDLKSDFYRYSTAAVPVVRCQTIGFGPLKFRVFWARIGNGLYVASKPFILDDLSGATPAKEAGPQGHAMLRIRSRNWEQVLPEYRLGWAENNRRACLDNLGPLTSIARSLPGQTSSPDVCRCADHLYGAHLFCPEGGNYEIGTDGKTMTCSIHGSASAPKQAAAPAQDQSLGKLIGSFAGLQATLTFLEDGLHAVLMIDRK
ncbi:MAG: hypothetical protein HY290_05700 [Planctomycetia bacterium]|nr:hypothetical protein [Planctomycetia bacterium]